VRKLIVLAATAALGLAVPAGAAEGIKWHTSLEEAVKASEESGKLVMLTLHTEWCGFCTKLEQETWPAEAVIAKSADFECASVDPEKTEVSDSYDDGSYPRTLFIRSDGEVVSVIPGFLPPEDFVAEMSQATENAGKLAEAEELAKGLAKPEDDLPHAFKIGALYAAIGRTKDALLWLTPAYEGREALPEADRGEVALAYGLRLAADLQHEKCLSVLQPFIEAHPAHERAREARFTVGLAFAKTDKLTEARDVWQALANEGQDDWVGKASARNVEIVNGILQGQ